MAVGLTVFAGLGLDSPVGLVKTLDQPSLAAEDFSFYGQTVPSVFTFLGIGELQLSVRLLSAPLPSEAEAKLGLRTNRLHTFTMCYQGSLAGWQTCEVAPLAL